MKWGTSGIILWVDADPFVSKVAKTVSRISLRSNMHAVDAFFCFYVRVSSYPQKKLDQFSVAEVTGIVNGVKLISLFSVLAVRGSINPRLN